MQHVVRLRPDLSDLPPRSAAVGGPVRRRRLSAVFSAALVPQNDQPAAAMLNDKADRESILVELRRERGLTGRGDYRLPRGRAQPLVVQSGLTRMGRLLDRHRRRHRGGLARSARCCAELVAGAARRAILRPRCCPIWCCACCAAGGRRNSARNFPTRIDIIVRSLRAGHPVPIAINMVASEMPDPIGSEFGLVSDEITYGADLETAMRNSMPRRQDDLPLFVTAVAIQGSTGGNLGEILKTCRRSSASGSRCGARSARSPPKAGPPR